MTKVFAELGESPRKALKYPPTDAQDFAIKYIQGKLTDYAAPKPEAGFEDQMNDPNNHMSPLHLLQSVFPALPRAVLCAALEAQNGSLEGAVHLLLESGAQLSNEENGAPLDPPAADQEESLDTNLSAMQQLEDETSQMDHVLAITVPAGSRPNALLKITTTVGTVHARVPPGVLPGQSFFIRMRRGNPFATAQP